MQSVYSFFKSQNTDLAKEEKILQQSSKDFYQLYLVMIALLVELQECAEKLFETSKKQYVSNDKPKQIEKFSKNSVIKQLASDAVFQSQLKNHKITYWKDRDEYVRLIFDAIVGSEVYQEYINSPKNSFAEDKKFILDLYTLVIAPNEGLYEFLEESKISWLDDIPLANTIVLKSLSKIKENPESSPLLTRLYKDDEDEDFGKQLFRKTVLNNESLSQEIIGKTPNWDQDRIAQLDAIFLKMAITEFLHFPSIPTKVTINEYLEISKEYSTPKSSVFINGVLDQLVREYTESGKLKKSIRGMQ